MTLLRALEQREGEQMILFFRNSPTLYISPECLFLLVPQKTPQVPKQIGSSGRGSKWKKGSVCSQVLQVRENSEKKNSKTWSWDCYRVEYFPLFSRRQQLLFSVKKLIDYWAVNNVQFYLHPLFGLFWSFGSCMHSQAFLKAACYTFLQAIFG